MGISVVTSEGDGAASRNCNSANVLALATMSSVAPMLPGHR
jgi:hypothetical protein